MKKLSIVSYGLFPPSQMTFESLAALRSCGVVYSNSVDKVTAGDIFDLKVPLVPVAGQSAPRLLEKILKAFKKHSHVGLLIYGNPFFLNPQMEELLRAVSRLAETEVFPGISSFDMLINMFGMTKLSEKGLFTADLNFFMRDPKFEAGPDIFFFAPFCLNTKDGSKFRAKFIKTLCGKYPRRFPAYLVRCGANPVEVELIRGCMSCLPALLKLCGERHTLVIFSGDRQAYLNDPPPWLRFTVRDICKCG